jgi:predicted DNA-binding transcriptional regulator AlpA
MTNILRKPALRRKVSMGKTQIDEAIKAGILPPGVPILEGGKVLGWFEDEIDRYLEGRRAARDQKLADGVKVSPQPVQLREARDRKPSKRRTQRR